MANQPQVIHSFGRMEARITAMVPTDDGHGSVCRETGRVSGVVLLQIDVDKLRGLALRALRSKRKRSVMAGGGIVAIVKRGTLHEVTSAD